MSNLTGVGRADLLEKISKLEAEIKEAYAKGRAAGIAACADAVETLCGYAVSSYSPEDDYVQGILDAANAIKALPGSDV